MPSIIQALCEIGAWFEYLDCMDVSRTGGWILQLRSGHVVQDIQVLARLTLGLIR